MKTQEKSVISGGFYLKSRSIQNSPISKAPPHVREIWDWILMNVNHRDNSVCKRGQTIKSYKDIIEDLSWYVGWRKESYSKSQCETAMKTIKKAGMITTKKTTRGILIEVVKYSYYQNPKNYERHNEIFTITTGEPQDNHTINNEDKNDKNENNNINEEIKKSSDFSELKKTFKIPDAKGGGITKEFQAEALRIITALEISNDRKSAYFKAVKENSRNHILTAYAYAFDHPNKEARDGMFFWKLKELKKNAKH